MKFIKYLAVSLLALSFSQFSSAAAPKDVHVKFSGPNLEKLGMSFLYYKPNGQLDWSNIFNLPSAPIGIIPITLSADGPQVSLMFYLDNNYGISKVDVSGDCKSQSGGIVISAKKYKNMSVEFDGKLPKVNSSNRVITLTCKGS